MKTMLLAGLVMFAVGYSMYLAAVYSRSRTSPIENNRVTSIPTTLTTWQLTEVKSGRTFLLIETTK